jgi:glycerol dehydrogenase-like iron-containing ADH family enzyme
MSKSLVSPQQSLQSELALPDITPAPARIRRGWRLCQQPETVQLLASTLGSRVLMTGGSGSLQRVAPILAPLAQQVDVTRIPFGRHCSQAERQALVQQAQQHQITGILGIGGGKALDMAKLVADDLQVPIATVPTSAATCAAWSALSNLYSEQGAFYHDVTLARSPDLVLMDYTLIQSAPVRTLRAGIGDALAKWYEASVSSRCSEDVLVIGAVQQARVLRDLLFQKAEAALADPGSLAWQQVVDAAIVLAGIVGGMGGSLCRTVAAHAVHNGLTHLPQHKGTLHGEKVAYGILVQQRLEEILQGNQLAATARQQLLSFYQTIGLPITLADLGLELGRQELLRVTQVACAPTSDIHHLPFEVSPEALMVAMQTTALADTRAKAESIAWA